MARLKKPEFLAIPLILGVFILIQISSGFYSNLARKAEWCEISGFDGE